MPDSPGGASQRQTTLAVPLAEAKNHLSALVARVEQGEEIAITRKQGSITLEESLAKLVRDGVVDLEDARARAAHPEEFEGYLRGA